MDRLWPANAIVGPFAKLLQITDFCTAPGRRIGISGTESDNHDLVR